MCHKFQSDQNPENLLLFIKILNLLFKKIIYSIFTQITTKNVNKNIVKNTLIC